jgi:galactokinase/mevalonate kinase-like predicted kinase
LISTSSIDTIVEEVMLMGAYGVKLLGAGGCGFLLVICDPLVKKQISEKYGPAIFDFGFEKNGVSKIYPIT